MTEAPPLRAVIVDDELLARERLRMLLASIPGVIVVAECADGGEGLKAIEAMRPDVAFVDIHMRELGGMAMVERLPQSERPAIVFVTAHESHAVAAFATDAADYLLKPVTRQQLERSVNRIHERQRGQEAMRFRTQVAEMVAGRQPPELPSQVVSSGAEPSIIRFGDLVVDRKARSVRRAERVVNLAPKEFDLLEALMRRPGAVVRRDELLRELWGYQSDVQSRTIDMHIKELRRKLESDPANPSYIITVRKMGYRFDPE